MKKVLKTAALLMALLLMITAASCANSETVTTADISGRWMCPMWGATHIYEFYDDMTFRHSIVYIEKTDEFTGSYTINGCRLDFSEHFLDADWTNEMTYIDRDNMVLYQQNESSGKGREYEYYKEK